MNAAVSNTENGSLGKMDVAVIMALFLVHFVGDFYMAFVSPLLPALTEKLSLSLAQVGVVTGLSQVMAFIIQPSVGYLADRYQTRFFVLGGPLLTAIFIPLFGWAGSYPVLLLFAALGAVGQSMFHPPAAGMVPAHAGNHLGFSMALFILGGVVSFGSGPVFVGWYVHRYGLEALPITAAFGAVVIVILFFVVPRPEGEGMLKLGFWGSVREILGPVKKPMTIILLIIVFRVFVIQSVLTFVPIMLAREGFSLVSVGVIVSAFIMAGSASSLIAGHLADRIGYRPVFLVSYLAAAPGLFLFFHAEGNWVYFWALTAGFFTLATLPLATAMAQSFVTKGQSMVASLTMGLAFGIGGVMTPLTGKLADLFSIRPVLSVVAWVPLLAVGLIWVLPEPNRYSNRT